MRFAFLLLFGVLPATLLAFFAIFGAWQGAKVLFIDSEWSGIVFFLWASAGLWGTYSLIRAAIGAPTIQIRFGLYAGMIAIAPFVTWAAFDPATTHEPLLFAIPVAPFVVACYLLAGLIRAKIRGNHIEAAS